MRSLSQAAALVVALVVVVVAAVAVPADASSPVSGGRLFRFRSQQRQGEGVQVIETWDALMKVFVDDEGDPTDSRNWENTVSMKALRHLFKANLAKQVSGEANHPDGYHLPYDSNEKMSLVANTLGPESVKLPAHQPDDGCKDDSDHGGCQVRLFLNRLRSFAEANTAELDKTAAAKGRRLRIQGAGPTGLAAALYARARHVPKALPGDPEDKVPGKPLGTVVVTELRSHYMRQHMVTLKDKQSKGEAYEGGKVLLDAVGGKHLRRWFKYDWDVAADTIITARLEGILALAAMVAGVKIEYADAKPATVPAPLAFLRDTTPASWSHELDGAAFAVTEAKCAAPPGDGEALGEPVLGAFDVFVAADGAGSRLRRDPALRTADDDEIEYRADVDLRFAEGAEGGDVDNPHGARSVGHSATQHPYSVLAFVFGQADMCDAAVSWWNHDTKGVARRGSYQLEPLYVKKTTRQCMLEIPLRVKAGALVLRSMKDECGWNFNVFRARLDDRDGEKRRMRETFAVYRGVTNFASHENNGNAKPIGLPAAVTDFKANLREIKVYSVGMRVATSKNERENGASTKVYVGRHDAAKKRVFLLAGDAAREAVPDDGMGANNGMYMGRRAAFIARTWDADNVQEKIDALALHATAVAVRLRKDHAGWFDNRQVGSDADRTNVVPGLKLTWTNPLDRSVGGALTFTDKDTKPVKE